MATSAVDSLPSSSTATSALSPTVEGGATAQATVHGWGHPRKTTEEPGNYKVLIDSVEAALPKKCKSTEVLRLLCSIAVPNELLLQAHREQVPSYVATINTTFLGTSSSLTWHAQDWREALHMGQASLNLLQPQPSVQPRNKSWRR